MENRGLALPYAATCGSIRREGKDGGKARVSSSFLGSQSPQSAISRRSSMVVGPEAA